MKSATEYQLHAGLNEAVLDWLEEGPTTEIPRETFDELKLLEVARASVHSFDPKIYSAPTNSPILSITSERPTRDFGPTMRLEAITNNTVSQQQGLK